VSIDDICLSTALAAARQASNFIAKRFGNPQSCRLKEDMSAVTETDVDVEQLIKRIIKEQHPSSKACDLLRPWLQVLDVLNLRMGAG
jgi:fructose-1,6-bisphosphatase/inositol monophosphatase family enzyme